MVGESGNQSIQAQGPTHVFLPACVAKPKKKTNGCRRKQTTAQADSLAGSRNFLLAHRIRSSSHYRCRQFTIMKCRSHLALAKLPHRRPRNSERTGSSNLSFYLDMRRYALFLLSADLSMIFLIFWFLASSRHRQNASVFVRQFQKTRPETCIEI